MERLKIRVVAKGFSQTVGLDFNEKFSLVAKLNSVIILLSLAVNLDWPLFQLDVKMYFFMVTSTKKCIRSNHLSLC